MTDIISANSPGPHLINGNVLFNRKLNWIKKNIAHIRHKGSRPKKTFLAGMSVKGGGDPCPLRKCKFLKGKNKKCSECSETKENAKTCPDFFL